MKETKQFEINQKKTHSDYAEEIMKDFHFHTLDDTEEILVYEDGVYKLGGEITIKQECEKRIPNCTKYMVVEVTETIKRKTFISRKEFDHDQSILNVKNGLLNMETCELSKHTPDYPSRIQLPVLYNPKAGPVKFMKYLMTALPNHRDRTTLIEELTSIFCPQLVLEKIYVHVGIGGNGKSIYFYLIEEVVGKDNVSHISIHDLINNRFARAELDGKLANTYADIESNELKNVGLLKAIASQDPVQAEKKGKDPFTLRYKGRLNFSANKLPKMSDNSDGAYRKFVVIEWKTKFRSEEDGEGFIKNPNLKYELTTDEEKSGVLNLILKTRKKLISQKRLTYERSIEQTRTEWQERADPIPKFIEECLVESSGQMVPVKTVRLVYEKWCKRNNIPCETNKVFNKELKENLAVEQTTSRYNGHSTKVWKGVILNPNNESVTEVTSVTDSITRESKDSYY
jgi:putative DNA primase/helicase